MENVNLIVPEEPVLFTQEEIEKLGLTAEELAILSEANALARTAAMIPDDEDKISDRFNKEFPEDTNAAFSKFFELSQSDPDYFKILLALNEVFGSVSEIAEFAEETPSNGQVSKVSASDLQNQVLAEKAAAIIEQL